MRESWRKLLPEGLPEPLLRLLLWMFIPVTLLLAYLLRDLIRTYILEPIIFTFRIGSLIYSILPQYAWWVGVVFILAVIAVRSLRVRQTPYKHFKPVEQDRLSQVSSWNNLIELAAGGSYPSRWLLARQVARLVVDIIAHQERLTPGQARLGLQSGQIKLPADIQAYILTGLGVPTHSQFADLLPLRSAQNSSPLELDPKIVLEYLEKRIITGGLL